MSNTDPLSLYFAFRDRLTRTSAGLFAHYAPHLKCRRGCYYCCDAITVLPIEIEAARLWLEENGMPDSADLGGPEADRGETPQAIVERDRRHSVAPNESKRSADRSAFGVFPPIESTARCAFLGRAGECTLYGGRPLICRTHGLPLAYRVYEYDEHGREVRPDDPEYTDLWCDLNFRSLSDEQAPAWFDEHGRVYMDEVHRELERLNEAFLDTEVGTSYRRRDPSESSSTGERLPLGVLLERYGRSTPRTPRLSVEP